MGRSQTLILLFLLFSASAVFINGVTADECTEAIFIKNKNRRADNKLELKEEPLSDRPNIDPNVWYRFESPTGNKITGNCVRSYQCGTTSPIWINGPHPTAEAAGPVELAVCSPLRCDGDCCGWTEKVQVKWCKNSTTEDVYFAYKLTPPPFLGMAYCVGDPTTCAVGCTLDPQTKKCNCPNAPPMTKPVWGVPTITGSKTVHDPNDKNYAALEFIINCTIGYPRQEVDDGARFDVAIESNGVKIFGFTGRTSTEPFVSVSETMLYGHLGTNITAKVFPYWKENKPDLAVFQVSDVIWLGIKPYDENSVEITGPITIKEGEHFKFQFVANFPITSMDCFNKSKDVVCNPFYTFRVFANDRGLVSSCSFQLTPGSNSSNFITIMPRVDDCKKVEKFVWQLAFEKKTENNIFLNYQPPNIIVYIDDRLDRPRCKSTGDPHITTFPIGVPLTRNTFHYYAAGVFYLVKATSRRYEVQVQQYPCTPKATCNCAVMVREGNNIVGIDACQQAGEQRPADFTPRLVRLLFDKTYPSGTIRQISNKYWITTLSGIEISVEYKFYRGFDYLDIAFPGLTSDDYTGLCTFNATPTLAKNNNVCQNECEQYRVPEEESMFNYNQTNSPKCVESFILPSCDCSSTETEQRCSASGFILEQDNLLKTNLACDGKSPYNLDIEDYLDVEIIINITVRQSSVSTVIVNPTWPTEINNITEEQAKDACTKELKASKFYDECATRKDININDMITSCMRDIQSTDDLLFSSSIESPFDTDCYYSTENAKVLTNNATDKANENVILKQSIIARSKICPRNCHDQGTCDNGTCHCNKGFTGRFCALTEGQVPSITKITNAKCNLAVGKCTKIYLTATNWSQSDTLACQMNSTTNGIEYDKSPRIRGNILICTLPKPTLGLYEVSLSNDGKTYSNQHNFTVYRNTDKIPVEQPDAEDPIPDGQPGAEDPIPDGQPDAEDPPVSHGRHGHKDGKNGKHGKHGKHGKNG